MYKDLLIAWRNLWRNRRRTAITLAAVILAVFFSTFASSMQEGTYARMIDNIVQFYTGYIQIQHPGYWESKSINDVIEPDSAMFAAIGHVKKVTLAVPRLESFTLISSGENTKGCMLIGIDPKLEDRLTRLSAKVIRGSYLKTGDKGILLAVNIAKNLAANPGDTLILLSQGFQGSTAAALMPVRGIIKFPSPELNNFAAYITLQQAGEFFNAPGKATSIALMISDYRALGKISQTLRKRLGSGYSVKTWEEMQPELVQMIQGDRAGAIVMKGILYMIVGFGVLGTIIMMMAERRKEMGVMMAIGMKKYRLQRILCFESLFMGMFGVILGVLVSIPVVFFLVHHPIPLHGDLGKIYETFGIEAAFFFSRIPKVFVNQAVTVFIITLLIMVYPVLTVRNMHVIRALRGQ
jgi:putative ABC transport system permease protein